MKLACVIHRFGPEIAGGSEGHCRLIAEHLAASHDVTILTTSARDHITWHNEYPAGVSEAGPLHVRRFPVARARSLHRFHDISEVVFSGGATPSEQEQWFRENGPEAPDLLEYLTKHGGEFDRILFWSFRYYQTFFGLPLVADRAVLVPTAEEDPVIRLGILDAFFSKPAGYLFLTPEEQTLVALHTSRPLAVSAVIGVGLDSAPAVRAPLPPGVTTPYVLYLGRIDPNKGCGTLLRFFMKRRQDRLEAGSDQPPPRLRRSAEASAKAEGPGLHAESTASLIDRQASTTALPVIDIPLVMAGPPNMPIPDDPAIKRLGFVTPAVRETLLANATALVVPSPYESLSMVLLEAWNYGVPALVNARCRVLKGQALRSDGALYYQNYDEFAHGLDFLLGRPDAAREIGRQGLAYVEREYRWPTVVGKIQRVLEEVDKPKLKVKREK